VTAPHEQPHGAPGSPAPQEPGTGAPPAGEPPAGQEPPQQPAAAPAGADGDRRPGGPPEDHGPAYGNGGEDDQQASGAGETASAALDQDLAATKQALTELTTDLQRLQAEYVNYKRRVERDRELVRQNATYSVLSGLLPVLDDIDRAREHGELEGGFKAVADSLERIVSGLGLTKFGAKGDEFDPNLHEALMHGHSPEVTTTTVDVVAHAGYRIGDRVVRAAKVTVLDPEG
jgi:molecular chaperone GrpE